MLSKEFNIKSLCEYMKISRSGYYKWIKNKDTLNQFEKNRLHLKKLKKNVSKKRKLHIYLVYYYWIVFLERISDVNG